jgi:ATPase subunit of ABC transporter with duplicated ATPase domains
MKGINIGYLAQEPQLDPNKDVRGNVEEGLGEMQQIVNRYNAVGIRLLGAFHHPKV